MTTPNDTGGIQLPPPEPRPAPVIKTKGPSRRSRVSQPPSKELPPEQQNEQ